MSQLPEEWENTSLGKIATFFKGKGVAKKDISIEGLECIRYGELFTTYSENITKIYSRTNSIKDMVLSKSNDTLMPTSDVTPRGLATASALSKEGVILGGDILIIRSDRLLNSYLSYYIRNHKPDIMKLVTGSTVYHIYGNDMKKFRINVPPLEEQKKIADILSTVDQKIAFVEDNIAQTKELKKGLRQTLFNTGINHSSFKNTDLGKCPESWEIKKLGDITTLTAGGTPSTKIKEYWTPKEIPWLSSGEVNKKIVFNTENKISVVGLDNSSAKLVPKNSVLIGLAGQGKTRGTVAITEIELSTNQSVASIFPNDNLDMYFIYHNLDSRYEEIRAMSTGVGGRGGLNLAILKSIKIALPPIEEQNEISKILKTVDKKLEVLKDKKESFEELKKGLMQKLLTGEVRV